MNPHGIVDHRVWEPDDTCSPFLFETGVAAADLLMGRFTVPHNTVAVIASIATQTSTQVQKSTQRIVIVKGSKDAKTDVDAAINPRGALVGVEELDATGGGNTGTNRVGFVLTLGGIVRPCRVILESGNYEVIHVGTNGLAFVSLFGWIFRLPA